MIEILIHPDADRVQVILELEKLGPVRVRNATPSVCLCIDAINIPQVQKIQGVMSAEDGNAPASGHATMQTHVFDNQSADPLFKGSLNNLRCLGVLAPRRFDISVGRREITLDRQRDGTGVEIAVIDSGIQFDAVEFGTRLLGRFNDEYPTEGYQNHGTRVACAAAGSNFGMAPGADITDFRCFDGGNSGTTTTIINCMDAVVTRHQAGTVNTIANLSGGGTGSNAYAATLLAMVNAGVVFICSAGNNGEDLSIGGNDYWPAEDANAIAVAGLDQFNRRHPETNYGNVQIWAYYDNHFLLTNAGRYSRLSRGTSFSSPQVAGYAACLIQDRPKFTTKAEVDAFRFELIREADVTGNFDRDFTPRPYNRLLASEAVAPSSTVAVSAPSVPDPSPTEFLGRELVVGAPDNGGAVAEADSTSAFALKGEVFTATRDLTIRAVSFSVDIAAVREIFIAKLSGYTTSDTFSEVYRQPVRTIVGAAKVPLTTDYQVDSGDIIFVGILRSNQTGATSNGLRFHGALAGAMHDELRGSHALIHAGGRVGGRRDTDVDPGNGDTLTDFSTGIWAASPAFFERIPAPIVADPVQFVGTGGRVIETSVTSLDVPYPSGIQSGDKIVLVAVDRSDGALNTPAGYTLVGSQEVTAGSADQFVYVYQRDADGSETGNLTISNSAAANRMLGEIVVYRGSSLTVQIDAQGTSEVALNTDTLTGVNYAATDAVALCALTYVVATVSPTFTVNSILQMGALSPAGADQQRLLLSQRDIKNGFDATTLDVSSSEATLANGAFILFSVRS